MCLFTHLPSVLAGFCFLFVFPSDSLVLWLKKSWVHHLAALVKEFDSPARLFEKQTLFAALVHEYTARSVTACWHGADVVVLFVLPITTVLDKWQSCHTLCSWCSLIWCWCDSLVVLCATDTIHMVLMWHLFGTFHNWYHWYGTDVVVPLYSLQLIPLTCLTPGKKIVITKAEDLKASSDARQ
jgi:hypothetical protein